MNVNIVVGVVAKWSAHLGNVGLNLASKTVQSCPPNSLYISCYSSCKKVKIKIEKNVSYVCYIKTSIQDWIINRDSNGSHI